MVNDQPDPEFSRRKAVKLAGASLVGASLATTSVAAKSTDVPDPASVNPDDEESVKEFLKSYLQLETVEEAEATWSGLTDDQEQAVVAALHKYGETRTKTVSTNRRTSSDSVSVQAIPVSYNQTVEHIVLGQVIYYMTHTIEWEIVAPYTTVSGISTSTTGGTNVPFWEWRGVSDSDLNTYSSYFDSYVQGEVEHTVPNNTYNPVIELRGNADGSGEVLQSDNGF
ncbi:hypothetical protein [Halorubrum sp. FL23]|uniref:hypothetical protein n=1 Tax=Halorubrum sp. FL23 TaxID=3458704 RepID=UPI004033B3F9